MKIHYINKNIKESFIEVLLLLPEAPLTSAELVTEHRGIVCVRIAHLCLVQKHNRLELTDVNYRSYGTELIL